ncbi:MAG: hypothetical protein JKY51_01825 [Opitutaceae bacterium]|nr:hypothetical protein [Opitutaceae bacterium]
MKKTLAILFGISVFAGAGYATFAYTPIGKMALSKWLIKKWMQSAEKVNKKLDRKKLEQELKKLKYSDHELLVKYTMLNPLEKKRKGKLNDKAEQRFKKLIEKMTKAKIYQRADLSQLDNIVLPG